MCIRNEYKILDTTTVLFHLPCMSIGRVFVKVFQFYLIMNPTNTFNGRIQFIQQRKSLHKPANKCTLKIFQLPLLP